MNILKKLSNKNLCLNKKRSIVTIIGIILSVSLITAVSGMFTSVHKTILQNAINESGYYHVELSSLTNDDIKKIEANRDIKELNLMYDLGFSLFTNTDKETPYIHVYSTEKFEELSFNLIEGKLPNNNSEIIINRKAASYGKLKIGDTITLNIGVRKTSDGYELKDSNPFNEENEEILENTQEKTYKIVGIFTKPGYNYNNFALTTKEQNNRIIAYAALKNPKNYKTSIPELLGLKDYNAVLERMNTPIYEYDVNTELLRWEVFAFSDSTISMLYAIFGVVIVIIMVTSIFCIRNSFAISATEKTKMYGMLSSIGATKKQIKKSVIYEGLVLGIIGIPLGILSGIFAVYVLINVVNIILDGTLFANLDRLIFNITALPIIFGSLLGLITIYASSLSPAIKALHTSPIENLTNSERVKINPKNLKNSRIIDKIFGIGGTLAYKNLGRSKKKYRTTVISLTVSISIFISMNTFLHEAFDLTSKYYKDYDYNIEITNSRKLTDEELNKMKRLDGVKDFYTLYEINDVAHGYIKIKDQTKIELSQDMGYGTDCYYDENGNYTCDENPALSIMLLALDNDTFISYTQKLGIDYDKVKESGILIDEYKYWENGKDILKRTYNYKDNDIIEGTIGEDETKIKIAKVSSIRPYGLESSYYSGGYLVVNKDYYENLNFEPYHICINAIDADELEEELENINTEISISNFEELKRSDEGMKLIVSIFLYGFITVITLIGITNIFNTITANMNLRKKEFGVLKSIGMTKKEFKKMINLETLFYSSKSLIYGILLGLIGSYSVHWAFSEKNETAFEIPFIPIIISIISVLLLVFIIMRFSLNKINKQNVIEQVREDNI